MSILRFFFIIAYCIFYLEAAQGQTTNTTPLSPEIPIYLEGFDYPMFDKISTLFVPNPITETKVPEFPKYLYSIFILYFKFLSKKFTALVQ